MEVTTDIKRRDLIFLNLVVMPRIKSTYFTIIFISVLVFSLIVWKQGIPSSLNNWVALLAGSFAGGVIGMFAGFIISLIFILFSSSDNNGTLGKHNYKITSNGLFEKTKVNEGLSKWEGIQEIKVMGSYALFQISGYLFHVIPKRSFASEESYNSFVETSLDYWEKAHNKMLQSGA